MGISTSRKIYVAASTVFLIVMCAVMVLPFVKVLAESLSSAKFVEAGEVYFWPKGLNFTSYRAVFNDPSILRAFRNSGFVTLVGTLINLIMTALLAYPTSRKEFGLSKPILFMIVVTLIFSAPLIPNYIVIKNYGMTNTLWALMVPSAISSFNFFVLRSFFKSIPEELIDAARIDGCSEMRILFNIVMPLSKPSLAAIGLFYAVAHWNNLQGALVFIQDPKYQTLQQKLYYLIVSDVLNVPDMPGVSVVSPEGIRMATIIVATVPILLIYPFLQKYFIKGATLGSVKE